MTSAAVASATSMTDHPAMSGTIRDVQNQYTVIIEDGGDGWLWAHAPEVPGANGQGRTAADAKADLAKAIRMMLDYWRETAEAAMPESAVKDTVRVG